MPPLKPDTILPTAQEDAHITRAAMLDADAAPLDDAQWQQALAHVRRGRGPNKNPVKEQISIRLSPEVLAWFRATGTGWQGRMDDVLKHWVATQPSP